MDRANVSLSMPRSLKTEAEACAFAEGKSLALWLRHVVAEKVARERKAALDLPPLLARMRRQSG